MFTNTALTRKAIADIRTHKLQAAVIFIIIATAAATLALSLLVQRGADRTWERAFEDANGSHVQVVAGMQEQQRRAQGSVPLDWAAVATAPGVTESAGPYPFVWEPTILADGRTEDVRTIAVDGPAPTVATPLITGGSWLTGAGQVVLDLSFARERDVQVGDTVQYIYGTTSTPVTVVGIAANPSRGPYPDWDPDAWVTSETLATIVPDRTTWESLALLRLEDPEAIEPFLMGLHERFPNTPFGISDWRDAREDYVIWTEVNGIMLSVFSALALIAVGLIIANVIGGRVLAQFRDIGLMKAVGFTPAQVTRIFLIQHLLLALPAALLGLAAGTAVAPLLLDDVSESVNAPADPAFEPLLLLAILLGVLLVVALFTWLPATRGGRVPAVQAIATGAAAARPGRSRLARLAMRLRLPVPIIFGVKDAFARPLRATMTVAALALSVITIISALGVNATIGHYVDNPTVLGEPFDLEVQPGALTEQETMDILAAHPRVTNVYSQSEVRADMPGQARQFVDLSGVGGDYQAAGFTILDGRMLAGPGEAVVGDGFLERFGLQLGDTVNLEVSEIFSPLGTGQELSVQVVGVYATMDDRDSSMMVPLDTLRQALPDVQPFQYLVTLDDGADKVEVERELVEASGNQFTIASPYLPPGVDTLRRLMVGMGGVLLLIGLANLFSTTLLTTRERLRDFGIAKTVGFTPRQVTASVVSGVSLLALLAAAIGLPLGVVFYRGLFSVVGEGMMDAPSSLYYAPSAVWLALIVPGVIVAACIGSGLPARLATRVQVAEVLRYE